MTIKSHISSLFDQATVLHNHQPTIFQWMATKPLEQKPFLQMDLYTKFNAQYTPIKANIVPNIIYVQKGGETCQLVIENARLCKVSDLANNKHGIRLIGLKGCEELYTGSFQLQNQLYNAVRHYCTLFHLTSEYKIIKLIGAGLGYKLYLCKSNRSEILYTVKSIEKGKLLENAQCLNAIVKEIGILRILDHPNIIKLHEVYEDTTHVHLILEHIVGTELSFQIRKKGAISEYETATVIKQLLSAIEYMHHLDIFHRDLKAEMIIMCEGTNTLKITNFGLATVSTSLEYTRCGSPGYVAPEVFSGYGYSHKIDIFSAGSILYLLLTGISLFKGRTFQETLSKNISCQINYDESCWKHISKSALLLLQMMLNPDPNKRPEASICIKNEWVSCDRASHYNLVPPKSLFEGLNYPLSTPCLNLGETCYCSEQYDGSISAIEKQVKSPSAKSINGMTLICFCKPACHAQTTNTVSEPENYSSSMDENSGGSHTNQ